MSHAKQKCWDEGIGYQEREVFEAFLKLPVAQLHTLHSVSINLSYRITLGILIQDERIFPVNVGGHDAVY